MDPRLLFALVLPLLQAPPEAPKTAPEPLSFREFFDPNARGLVPSARLLSLVGKRVSITGFMADAEEPPRGGFYLCPMPLFVAEGGAGTADLPPSAVFVVVRSATGKELETLRRPLEVTGTLELGPQVDADGRVSRIRIILDRPQAGEIPSSPPKVEEVNR
jgi:hypothetical protein